MSTSQTHPHPPLFKDARCTCAALRRTTRLVTNLYDDALRPLGLKLTQYALLRNVRDAGSPSITALADMMMMDRTTLTRNLTPLRKSGWIAVSNSDGRTRAITLTPEGKAVMTKAAPIWRQTEDRVRDLIGLEDARDLRTRLDVAGQKVKSAAPEEV